MINFFQKLIIQIVKKNRILPIVIIFLIIPQDAFSYIGPGMAVSTILLVLGVVGSLMLAILAVVYYPIKRLIKKKKSKKNKTNK